MWGGGGVEIFDWIRAWATCLNLRKYAGAKVSKVHEGAQVIFTFQKEIALAALELVVSSMPKLIHHNMTKHW